MTNTYIIKIGEWYYMKYSMGGPNLIRSTDLATKFAHVDNAKQEIIDQGLIDAKVYQHNSVEQEVK